MTADDKISEEGKRKAYEEMCQKPKDKDGKYSFTFDEVVDIVERNMGIPRAEVYMKLNRIAEIQKRLVEKKEDE